MVNPSCINAHIVRQTSDGPRYLMIRRCCNFLPGTWQMVTGTIEEGETAVQAAWREIQEETGLVPKTLYIADIVDTFYLASNNRVGTAPVFVAFVEEETIRLSPEEHDAFEWLAYEEAKSRLFWSQKQCLDHVHHEFVLKKPPDSLLSTNSAKSLLLRTGVYAVAEREKKLLVVVQQLGPHKGKFDLPGGGIESGESIEEALKREMLEETGMQFQSMRHFDNLVEITDSLQRICLVYRIEQLTSMPGHTTEPHLWVEKSELPSAHITPLLKNCLFRDERVFA